MNNLIQATLETILMLIITILFSYILALPLAIITHETSEKGLTKNKLVNLICNVIIGAGRAIPFTILMVLLLPFTRFILGTGVGTIPSTIPLIIASTPFVARTIEQSLNQVPEEIVQASKIDGANNLLIIFKIKLGVRLYDLIDSLNITSIAIISYTAIVGTVGGGGLGNYALTNGFYKYDWMSVLYATVIIIGIVVALQITFRSISKKIDWRD